MNVHASSLVRFFCFVTMVAIFLSGVAAGLAGSWSAIGFLGVIFLFTSKQRVKRQPLILLLSLMLVFYFGLRLWDLYVFDLDNISSFFSIARETRAGVGGRAMLFAMISCLLMYLGLALAARPKSAENAPYADFEPLQLDVNKRLLFNILLVAFLIEGSIDFGYVFIRQGGFIVKLASLIAHHEALLPLAAIAFSKTAGWGKVRLYVLLAIILVSTVLSGLRSGPIDIIEIMLAWAVIPGNWTGMFKVTWKRCLVVTALVVVSVGAFVVATVLRQSSLGAQQSATSFSSMFAGPIDIWNLALFSYEQIAYRVGTNMDALFWVFSSSFDSVYANAHVNLITMVETTVRTAFFVPMSAGVNFDEYEFANLLGNRGSLLNGEFVPTGYSWGVFAYFFQIFGYWAWPILFGLFLGLGVVFQKLARAAPRLRRDMMLYCVAHATGLLVPMFGLANLVGRYRGMAVTFVAIALLMPLLRKRPSYVPPMPAEVPQLVGDN